MTPQYFGLRVDVCTYQGLRQGVPNLLRLFQRLGIRATFFIALGPDYSGRAIFNLFRPDFLGKMLRTNAATMYGLRTMLYGTLLPAPIIAERGREIIREIQKDGHELGLHSWNHRRWQDKLDGFTTDEIRRDYDRAVSKFREVTGAGPIASAAPAWFTTPQSLRLQDEYFFTFASDCRGRTPFYPIVEGQILKTLQIPVTLPTLDEALGCDGVTVDNYNQHLLDRINAQTWPVYVMHAEAEGRRYLPLAADLLERLQKIGLNIGPLSALSRLAKPAPAAINYGLIPGRSGIVTYQSLTD